MDDQAFERLIEEEGKEIYSYCCYLTRQRDLADDLFQDALLSALRERESIDAEQNPRAFILALATNIWRNQRRKLAWRRRIAPTDSFSQWQDTGENGQSRVEREGRMTVSRPWVTERSENPYDVAARREAQEILRHLVDELSDRYRVPLLLFYTAELSVRDIAKALELPEGTVKSRLHHARKKLKEALKAAKYEPA